MNSFPRAILCGVIRLYQWGLSPALSAVFGPFGFGCRFTHTAPRICFWRFNNMVH